MATWNDPNGPYSQNAAFAEQQRREAEYQRILDDRMAEQRRQMEADRRAEEQRREMRELAKLSSRKQERNEPRIADVPLTDTKPEKSWSTLAAVLGFLGAAGAIYAETEPEVGGAMLGGIFGAYLAGRFYKVILWIGVAILVLKMMNAS